MRGAAVADAQMVVCILVEFGRATVDSDKVGTVLSSGFQTEKPDGRLFLYIPRDNQNRAALV